MISTYKVCDLSQIDTIITDDSIAPELAGLFRSKKY
jgi:DeoR/GlpR family transcriptional regulator of sugar metabolism